MVFGRKKKEEGLDDAPPIRGLPEGFKKKYGASASENLKPEVEEEQEFEDYWELIEIPPTEPRYVIRNKVTGDEIEPTLKAFVDFLNGLKSK